MNTFRRPEAAWFAAVAFLVALPFVLDVSRAQRFESSVELLLRNERGIRGPDDREAYVRGLLALPHVENNLFARSGVLVSPGAVARTADIEAERPRVVVAVSADSPRRASDVATALGRLVSEAAGENVAMARGAVEPQPARLADRVLDRLPGPLPPTPHPVLAAAVGFVVALLLYDVFFKYVRRISE